MKPSPHAGRTSRTAWPTRSPTPRRWRIFCSNATPCSRRARTRGRLRNPGPYCPGLPQPAFLRRPFLPPGETLQAGLRHPFHQALVKQYRDEHVVTLRPWREELLEGRFHAAVDPVGAQLVLAARGELARQGVLLVRIRAHHPLEPLPASPHLARRVAPARHCLASQAPGDDLLVRAWAITPAGGGCDHASELRPQLRQVNQKL